MVFALNATVTLTFDLVTSKCIRVIYWPWPIFLLCIMTVTQKLFKIWSGHDVANGRSDRRTDGQTDGRTLYHNTSEVSLRGYKKRQRAITPKYETLSYGFCTLHFSAMKIFMSCIVLKLCSGQKRTNRRTDGLTSRLLYATLRGHKKRILSTEGFCLWRLETW